MKISIAMTTFNGAHYVQEQLESFTAQTLLPNELVVCDDNSSDDTWDLLQKFKQTAPFAVRLYRNETNLGYTKNFERVIGLAEGAIIFLSDQDDVWFARKLEAVVAFFAQHPTALVITSDQEIADAQLRPTGLTTFGQFKSAGYSGSYFTVGCCTAVRASLKPVILPIPLELNAHDIWLHYLAESMNVRKILPKVLQYHRRHEQNASDPSLNPTTRVAKLAIVRSAWSNDPYEICEHRKKLLRMVATRLKQASAEALLDTALVNFQTANSRIEREQVAICRRQTLLRIARAGRMPWALMMLLRGDYRYFSGWKSLIKDLMR